MLTITEQIPFIKKISSKMLIDVNDLAEKPTEHKTCYIKSLEIKYFKSY